MKKRNQLVCLITVLLFLSLLYYSSFSYSITDKPNQTYLNASPDVYENDNDFTSAKNITLNSLQERSISSVDDVDYIRFFLDSFYDVGIEVIGLSGDTRMWLFDSSKLQLAYDDDGGVNQFSQINLVFLRPGDYYIKIDEFGNDNTLESYNLTLSATISTDFYEPDDTPANCIPLLLNSHTQRSLYPVGDWDYFTFTIVNTYNITLEISGTDGDTEMWLFWDPANEGASIIDYADDGGVGGFSKIVQNNLSPGSYYVRISEYGDNSEVLNYTLSLIASSEYVSDSEGPNIFSIETFPFTPLSSSEILFIVGVSDPSGVEKVNLHYKLNEGLWDTTEMIYDSAQDYGIVVGPYGVGDNFTYYITAYDSSIGNYLSTNDNSGAYYNFKLDSIDPLDSMEKDDSPAYARDIYLNSTIDRRIYPVLDVDYCTFELLEEHDVVIETSGTSGDTVLFLYDTNLTLISVNDNSGIDSFSKIILSLESGNYTIRIVENGDDDVISSYAITLTAYEIHEIHEFTLDLSFSVAFIIIISTILISKNYKKRKMKK